jgi:hypothetical protein
VDAGAGISALFNIRCGVHFLFLVPAANTTAGWGVMVKQRIGSCSVVRKRSLSTSQAKRAAAPAVRRGS